MTLPEILAAYRADPRLIAAGIALPVCCGAWAWLVTLIGEMM